MQYCLKKFGRGGESMKTWNFIKSIEELSGLGLKVDVDDETIFVKNRFDRYVLVIERDELCAIETRFNGFRTLSDGDKIGLYSLCNRYVMSDVGDRESKLKYALEHKWMNFGRRAFLNYNKFSNVVTLDTVLENSAILTLLTVEDWEKYTGRTIDELMQEFKPVNENDFKKLIDSAIW